jgi:hypothetical protein
VVHAVRAAGIVVPLDEAIEEMIVPVIVIGHDGCETTADTFVATPALGSTSGPPCGPVVSGG